MARFEIPATLDAMAAEVVALPSAFKREGWSSRVVTIPSGFRLHITHGGGPSRTFVDVITTDNLKQVVDRMDDWIGTAR